MKNIILLFSSLTILGITGCASYYEAPEGVATARMEFITNVRPVMVQVFADEQCNTLPQGVRLAYIDPAFDSEGKYSGPRDVIAGKSIVVTLKKTVNPYAGGYTCAKSFKFTPQVNQKYLGVLRLEGDSCFFNLKLKVNDELKAIPDIKELPDVCFTINA